MSSISANAAGTPQPPRAEFDSHPLRGLLHLLIALAGWTLFTYWWWLVMSRVTDREIRFTFLFLAVALAVILGLTLVWVVHNQMLFRRKRPRRRPVESPGFVKRDALGRRVRFTETRQTVTESPLVRVDVEEAEKVYYRGLLEIL